MRILKQVEKRGKSEKEVFVKHVRFFPIKGKVTNEVSFGRLGFTVLKMLLEWQGSEVAITWSGAGGGPGNFKFHYPNKQGYEPIRCIENNRPVKDRKGKPMPDMMKPMITVKGEVDTFSDHEKLVEFLVKRAGEDVTVEILQHFANRLAEVNTAKAKAAAKREAEFLAA